jgi:hypothetical protein
MDPRDPPAGTVLLPIPFVFHFIVARGKSSSKMRLKECGVPWGGGGANSRGDFTMSLRKSLVKKIT